MGDLGGFVVADDGTERGDEHEGTFEVGRDGFPIGNDSFDTMPGEKF